MATAIAVVTSTPARYGPAEEGIQEERLYTVSQAVVHMMERVAAPMISRELTNSPDAFLWLHLRSWLQSRQAPVTVEWVRGHSGDPGNERADHLATSAHDNPSAIRWTTQMPPPDNVPVWILHDGRVVPRRVRRLFREQVEAIIHQQLVEQVNAVPHMPTQSPTEVKHILLVLRWTVLPSGEVQKKKKCWNITNIRDSTIRAFTLKLLMGFLPTLARQRAWYPEVYGSCSSVPSATSPKRPRSTSTHAPTTGPSRSTSKPHSSGLSLERTSRPT